MRLDIRVGLFDLRIPASSLTGDRISRQLLLQIVAALSQVVPYVLFLMFDF